METALDIGLANVAVAALISLTAMGASLIRSRPAIAHALWLLVLIKLLTPGLWGVHIHWPWGRGMERWSGVSQAATPAWTPPTPSGRRIVIPYDPPVEDLSEDGASSANLGESDVMESVLPPPLAAPSATVASRAPAVSGSLSIPLAGRLWVGAGILWILGSIVCAGVILVRIVRFQRLLRFATPVSPALQGRADALARRMGLVRSPRIWMVPGAVCPMLWPVGRGPRVLVPLELWDRLGEGQRWSLLAHELAHVRRRDHWVRLPEVLASVLYWWCPLMWYARRRLRESEEQCCDAWVVWALPGAGREYARALVETVEFVSEGIVALGFGTRSPLPMLASGMGQFHQLKRRLVMIQQTRVSRGLSGCGWLAVGALAVGLLPLAPTLAQESAPVTVESTSAAAPVGVPPASSLPGVALRVTVPVETTAVPAAEVGSAPPSAVNVDQPESTEAPIINELKSKPIPMTPKPLMTPARPGADSADRKIRAELEATRAQVRELTVQLDRAKRQLADLEKVNAKSLKGLAANKYIDRRQAKGDYYGQGYDAKEPAMPKYADGSLWQSSGIGSSNGVGIRGQAGADVDPNAARARRLDAVEANLKALLEEVRAMREEAPQATPHPKSQSK